MSDHYEDERDFQDDPKAFSASWSQAASASEPTKPSFDVSKLAEWLPRLGPVLWLDRRGRRRASARAAVGAHGLLLLEHPALAPLTQCVSAAAHTQITSHGPREWLCFRDAGGEAQARMFLLPDTDYLAWDEMSAAADLAPAIVESARWHAHAAFLHSALARLGTRWQARLLAFESHRLPWLRTLGAKPPLRLSLLGLELARLIARGEGAELVSPLHAS